MVLCRIGDHGFEHGLIALFHDAELHDHPTTPSIEPDQRSVNEKADRDQQMSRSYRSHCRPATDSVRSLLSPGKGDETKWVAAVTNVA